MQPRTREEIWAGMDPIRDSLREWVDRSKLTNPDEEVFAVMLRVTIEMMSESPQFNELVPILDGFLTQVGKKLSRTWEEKST